MKNKIVSLTELVKKATELRMVNKKVVSTSGCFDILHAGHVTYLEEAKAKGDILIVLLNSDQSVRKLKGKERPIVPEKERAAVLAGLEAVDYVCFFEEETPCDAIAVLQPDVVVKGGDYEGIQIPEMDAVKAYGGTVQYVSMVQGCSSTNIIEKIKRSVQK